MPLNETQEKSEQLSVLHEPKLSFLFIVVQQCMYNDHLVNKCKFTVKTVKIYSILFTRNMLQK